MLVRQDIWNNPLVSELDKAGLIWHEVLYRWLSVDKGDTNSVRARQIVGILFSQQTPDQMKKAIESVLNGSEPTPPNTWVCL